MTRASFCLTHRSFSNFCRRAADLVQASLLTASFAALSQVCAAASAAALDSFAPQNWWDQDVWADPERPFLYYGIEAGESANRLSDDDSRADEAKSFDAPRPLSGLRTAEEVRAESERRLSRAVMDPSPQNLAAYLEINDFLLSKSHEFAERLSRVRLQHPEWDWTASHATMNAATVELSARRKAAVRAMLAAAAPEIGLIFTAGPDSALNALAAGPAGAFAAEFGFSVLAAVPNEFFVERGLDPMHPQAADDSLFAALLPGLTDRPALNRPVGRKLLTVRAENGISAVLGGGAAERIRPALYAAADPNGTMPALAELRRSGPMRIASGPAAVADLIDRLASLIAPTSDFRADAKSTGDLAVDLIGTEAFTSQPQRRTAAEPHALIRLPQD